MALVLTLMLSGCLKNDIPYPRIQPNITAIAAEGQTKDAAIDNVTRNVTLYLDENVNIKAVHLTEFSITPGSHLISDIDTDNFNLSSPLKVTLGLYQDYVWTISAEQDITRYFSVESQIGESVIDVPGRRIIVTLPNSIDLKKIHVLSAKLGPADATVNPPVADEIIDLSVPFETVVTAYGEEQLWTIYADLVEATVFTNRVDAWSQVAWAYGSALEGHDNGFRYRAKGAPEWTDVADSDISFNGGAMTACIKHLSPETEYEVVAYSDTETGAVLSFKTEDVMQLPNSDFADWWKDNAVWCPWADGGTPFWDTGNKGAATLGQSNVTPSDDTPSGVGKAAKLESKFVNLFGIGKFASGSIYAGRYVATDGTNGILSFGRDFKLRPTKLRGYFKYNCATIDYPKSNPELPQLIGQPDTCIVWVALIDSPNPFEIRTNPQNRSLFNPNAPSVIAYGKMQCGETVSSYRQFDVNLNYVATDRVPKYILVVASSSAYGDYFTGGNGSTMYVADFELLYDY